MQREPATTTRRRQRPIKVGDRVEVLFGAQRVPAVVIEDRGAIGVGGRRLVRVRVEVDDLGNVVEFDYPAEELTSARPVGVAVRRQLYVDRQELAAARDALHDGHQPWAGFDDRARQALAAVVAIRGASADVDALRERLRNKPAHGWTVADLARVLSVLDDALA
jgi:hypothetical protein